MLRRLPDWLGIIIVCLASVVIFSLGMSVLVAADNWLDSGWPRQTCVLTGNGSIVCGQPTND